MLQTYNETTVESVCLLLGWLSALFAPWTPVLQALHTLCRLTDAGQPSIEHVRGMFAAMHGPSGGGALGDMSDEEDAEYAPKQPGSQVLLYCCTLEHCSACAAAA